MTIIFINGSFGVGKTSVARALRPILGGRIYDPEIGGSVIQAMPGWLKLTKQNSGDYQDMPLWRTMTVQGIRATRLISRTILVPMAFSSRATLDEIMGKVRFFDPNIYQFCLVAPLATVEARLHKRNDHPKQLAWQMRRARECCEAHRSEDFAPRLDASAASPAELAAQITGLVACGTLPPN